MEKSVIKFGDCNRVQTHNHLVHKLTRVRYMIRKYSEIKFGGIEIKKQTFQQNESSIPIKIININKIVDLLW